MEGYAEKYNACGILISKDAGWSSYAEKSSHLYCVSSLEDFVSLFESKGEAANAVKKKIESALSVQTSGLYNQLIKILDDHILNSTWTVDEGYTYLGRVEAYVQAVSSLGYDIRLHDLGLWLVEHDPSLCTIEVQVSVRAEIEVEVEFYHYDTIDHEEVSLGSKEITHEEQLELDVFMICRGDLLEKSADEWMVDIEISGDEYFVDLGEVDYDFED